MQRLIDMFLYVDFIYVYDVYILVSKIVLCIFVDIVLSLMSGVDCFYWIIQDNVEQGIFKVIINGFRF